MKSIRIGGGAGFAGDSIQPALLLLEKGELNYLVFECLAERTIALAQQQRQSDPKKGYNPSLLRRMTLALPLASKNRVKIVTNMGAANVPQAVERTAQIARDLGIRGLKIAGVLGDDVFPLLERYGDASILETGRPLSSLPHKVAANAYLGCAPIVEALRQGADVVITGRCSDPALFLGPMVYELGWDMADYPMLGTGTMAGHLMECSGQVSGGNFAIPGLKEVDQLWNLGYPIGEVSQDGTVYLSKIPGTGGRLDVHTCAEQLLYEIHDPACYLTPDCCADFSQVKFVDAGPNRVQALGASGKAPTSTYKVTVGYRDGFTGTAGISYGGPFCLERARLAAQVLERIIAQRYQVLEKRIDLIGINSLFPLPDPVQPPQEVRVRVAARAQDRQTLEYIADEVDTLTISGPANGGGIERSIKELVAACSFLLPKQEIQTQVIVEEV